MPKSITIQLAHVANSLQLSAVWLTHNQVVQDVYNYVFWRNGTKSTSLYAISHQSVVGKHPRLSCQTFGGD